MKSQRRGAGAAPAALGCALAFLFGTAGCDGPNLGPAVPGIPLYAPAGFVDEPKALVTTAWDLDGDSVSLRLDWGDGDTSDWTEPFPNSAERSLSHAWTAPGTYVVRAQARDADGAVSDWSGGRDVEIASGWTRTYGGPVSDVGTSLLQMEDGGYVVTGFGNPPGAINTDALLIRTDADGDPCWTQVYGGIGPDRGNEVCQTADDGFVVVGTTGSSGAGEYDVWLFRTDQDGNRLWDRTYGWSGMDEGYGVALSEDGGCVVAGSGIPPDGESSDLLLVRADADGDTTWTRTYGGSGYDAAHCVEPTLDGGYIVAGVTMSFGAGSADAWLIRTDGNGDSVWSRTYGGNGYDRALAVRQTRDGGFILTGKTTSYEVGVTALWLVKVGQDGVTSWMRTFGTSASSEGRDVRQTRDGGYVVAGSVGRNALLLRATASGDTAWTLVFGGPEIDVCNSVIEAKEGGFVIAGSTQSYGAGHEDVWLVRVDSEGAVSDWPGAGPCVP